MPIKAHQEEFAFPSLDFVGRSTVTVPEIAERIGVTEQHILNLIEARELTAVNLSRFDRGGRNWYRVPIESWHAFVYERLSQEAAGNPIKSLSTPALKRLLGDIITSLSLRGEDTAKTLTPYIDHD